MRQAIRSIAALCAMLAAAAAGAQSAYPTKPMRWVISNAPGGGADVMARPIAAKVSELLGQSIVYENRGGAGGLIAGEAVARLIAGGSIPRTTTPEQFVEENRREVEKWGKVMKKYGIVPK